LIAIATLVAAVLLRLALDPVMGDGLPLVTLFGAVAIAVWAGGTRPAVIVVAVGYLACAYLFIPPRGQIGPTNFQNTVGLVAYLFTCALIIAIGEAMRSAQQRASERGELLRVTLGSIGDAVITTDTKGRVTYLNPVAESLTGWEHREAMGRPLDEVFRIVNEETRAAAPNPALRALREGAVVGLANHTILIGKDGVERYIDDSAAPIRDEDGRISGCVLVFRDVSARRRAERDEKNRLLAARLLASIVESSDDAVIGKSLDGVIQSWNGAAERTFGYSAEEAVGSHISLIIPPERLGEEDQIIARLRAGHRVEHFETERRRRDGSLIFVSLTISPIRDDAGNVVGASKIARDVTRQREAEDRERRLFAEAAAANAKFRAFFDQGALFAGIMEVDGTILEPNRLSWEGCGFTREQIVGKKFWEGPWWTPSSTLVETIRAGSIEAAAGRTFRAELPYFVGDGSERIADIIILPIKDEAGRVLFLAPTGTDVTERKRAEAELSEVDRRKNEFLATLSHELRNPLAPLSHMLEVLKRGGHDEDTRRHALQTMERQLGHLVRLVDDLLDLSRITHNRMELRRGRVELASVIQQSVQASRPLAEAAGHDVNVVLPAEPIHLGADPVRLSQVFGNLLNNACRYTRPGGRIHVIAERRGTEAVVIVGDNGMGIPEDKLESIFEMFTQVESSLGRAQGGLGIGLTLVKRLVEMHGGSVEARSGGVGKGSEFVVRLPIDVALPEAAIEAPAPAPESTQARRILVVDDNRDAASSLAMLLQITGYETHVAHDGPAAFEAVEAKRPEVVLLDIGLPTLSGYEVCRRVREQPWGKETILIALTGWGQEEDRRKSQEAGFDGHLVKPVDYPALIRLLSSLAGRNAG
jgi:PAS domain S-box-containing protein